MTSFNATLPKRSRGRQTYESAEAYLTASKLLCDFILKIRSRLDFTVSSRGWAYILEEYGLLKGDFDAAQIFINECRKSGLLPLNICAEDDGRALEGVQLLDNKNHEDEINRAFNFISNWHEDYCPTAFTETIDVFIVMVVEKVDLKSLFLPVCNQYYIPIFNASGWSDINSRAAMMKQFKYWEERGKRCVLLYCGDHDPGGLNISDFLRSNLNDLKDAVGWSAENLEIRRFGLDYDFICSERLTWISNLETSSKKRLDDISHRDHYKPYVQNYIKRYGARKVEANALVIRPISGRKLCLDAIHQFISKDELDSYEEQLASERDTLKKEIALKIARGYSI